jgi:hypothetical protein
MGGEMLETDLDILHALLDFGANNLALQNLALSLCGLQHLLPLFWRHPFLLDALNFLAPFQCFGRWRRA